MPLTINEKLCPQNHACPMIAQCPVGAISQQDFDLPKIDTEQCIECGRCAEICGKNAVYNTDDSR